MIHSLRDRAVCFLGAIPKHHKGVSRVCVLVLLAFFIVPARAVIFNRDIKLELFSGGKSLVLFPSNDHFEVGALGWIDSGRSVGNLLVSGFLFPPKEHFPVSAEIAAGNGAKVFNVSPNVNSHNVSSTGRRLLKFWMSRGIGRSVRESYKIHPHIWAVRGVERISGNF